MTAKTNPVWSKILTYEFLAIAISAIILLPLILQRFNIGAFPVLPYHHYLGAIGPVSAAFLVVIATSGISGVKKWLRSIFIENTRPKWLLVAIGLPLIILGITLSVLGLMGEQVPDFNELGVFTDFGAIGIFLGFCFHAFTYGLGEELGWRGFLLPKLQKFLTPVKATLLLGVFWAIWHIPMFLYRPGYSSMAPAEIMGWLLSLFMGAVLLTWLFNRSGTVLAPILFHGVINTVFTMKALQGMGVNITGALVMFAAIAVMIFDRKLGLRKLKEPLLK